MVSTRNRLLKTTKRLPKHSQRPQRPQTKTVVNKIKCGVKKVVNKKHTKSVCMSAAFYTNIVKELRQNTNKIKICQEEKDTTRKCLLCRYYLSSMQWGPLLEKHIKEKFCINKAKNSTSGDGCSKKKKNIEIKVSLGTSQGSFNFVQIRPDHNIHYYLFLAYNLHYGKEGRIHWFLCKPQELYKLIPEYGGYAHGTVAKFGKITQRNMKGRNMEFALRPSPSATKGSKPHKLWQILLKKFERTEKAILKTI